MTAVDWVLLTVGLLIVAAIFAVARGMGRFRRSVAPDLGDLLATRLDPVSTEMDEQWDGINRLFTSTPCTPTPAYPLPTDEAVRRAGQLPLTWRERRALVDEFERIVNPEATR